MKRLGKLLTSPEAYFYSIGMATGMILFAPNGFVFLLGLVLGALALLNLEVRRRQEDKNV